VHAYFWADLMDPFINCKKQHECTRLPRARYNTQLQLVFLSKKKLLLQLVVFKFVSPWLSFLILANCSYIYLILPVTFTVSCNLASVLDKWWHSIILFLSTLFKPPDRCIDPCFFIWNGGCTIVYFHV
jgi:hypothetical protein